MKLLGQFSASLAGAILFGDPTVCRFDVDFIFANIHIVCVMCISVGLFAYH